MQIGIAAAAGQFPYRIRLFYLQVNCASTGHLNLACARVTNIRDKEEGTVPFLSVFESG